MKNTTLCKINVTFCHSKVWQLFFKTSIQKPVSLLLSSMSVTFSPISCLSYTLDLNIYPLFLISFVCHSLTSRYATFLNMPLKFSPSNYKTYQLSIVVENKQKKIFLFHTTLLSRGINIFYFTEVLVYCHRSRYLSQ